MKYRFIIFFTFLVCSSNNYAELIIFPAKGQSEQQMEQDKFSCYGWAKTQSGYDPMNPPKVAATTPAPQKQGGVLKGAVKGGAFGAIAGDSSDAAKRGAIAGSVIGGLRQRRANTQSAQQSASTQTTTNKAQLDKYNRAYSACLEGKGYTVK